MSSEKISTLADRGFAGSRKKANACIHKHLNRPWPEVERRNNRNTLWAGTFAKIGEAG